jgi:1,2-phenylacetyl-CoA epoxidase catalytic subunit
MDSSPEVSMAGSPALSQQDEYSQCLADYHELAQSAMGRASDYKAADRSYREQQEELYHLLEKGDMLWEKTKSLRKGSTKQKEAVAELFEAIDMMNANLKTQELTLAALEHCVQRAHRGMSRVAEIVPRLREQGLSVQDTLQERISNMRKEEPALMKKKQK